jgi:sugar-specific transcriptional regulator TrmB
MRSALRRILVVGYVRQIVTYAEIMQDQSLTQQLEAFGLNNIEAEIYLHLASKQPKTILQIARDLGLPRTSVYDNAIKLAEKGLVQKIVTFKSQRLKASPLGILQSLLDKQKAHLTELQDKLAILDANLAQTLSVPANTEVRYFYGAQGFKQMMWNTLKSSEHIGYSQFGRVEIVGETFTEKMSEELVKRGIHDRVLTNSERVKQYITSDTDNVTIREARQIYQNIRIIGADRLYISGDITMYDNIFAVAYWKQGEVVGVEIENAELVKTQRSIFELLWEIAEPVINYLPKTET